MDRIGLKEQVETLNFEKPDVAREQLNGIIGSLQVLMKKLDEQKRRGFSEHIISWPISLLFLADLLTPKRPEEQQSEYTQT